MLQIPHLFSKLADLAESTFCVHFVSQGCKRVSAPVVCSGLQKLVMKNIMYGVGEMYKGVFTSAQVKMLQRYIPEIQVSDVVKYVHTLHSNI